MAMFMRAYGTLYD